jgi:hypothetical protein
MVTAHAFRRELLPPARDFYEAELGKLTRPNRKGWCQARCPFHNSKSGKSFSINVETGGFFCFGCDVKGGDVVAFIRLRYRCDFKSAAKLLGCWRQESMSPRERRELDERQRSRELLDAAVEWLDQEIHKLRLEYREEIHTLERIQREMGERLKDLWVSPHSPLLLIHQAERDSCFHVLEMALPQLREAIAGYYLLSFGTAGEAADFVRHPDMRDAAINAVLNRGTVRDDQGYSVEVPLP